MFNVYMYVNYCLISNKQRTSNVVKYVDLRLRGVLCSAATG